MTASLIAYSPGLPQPAPHDGRGATGPPWSPAPPGPVVPLPAAAGSQRRSGARSGTARRRTAEHSFAACVPALPRRRALTADGVADLLARSAAYALSVLGLLYVVGLVAAAR